MQRSHVKKSRHHCNCLSSGQIPHRYHNMAVLLFCYHGSWNEVESQATGSVLDSLLCHGDQNSHRYRRIGEGAFSFWLEYHSNWNTGRQKWLHSVHMKGSDHILHIDSFSKNRGRDQKEIKKYNMKYIEINFYWILYEDVKDEEVQLGYY